jgi:RNA polymerase sigma-70 factor (ECF subfamily)
VVANPDQLTDAEIIAQVLAGNQAPYRLLVERHQQAVFNAAYRLLGQREEAADVSQDAFLRAFQALNSFQVDRPLKPWLCRIAINLALNRLKRQRPALSLDGNEDEPGLQLPDTAAEPQATLLQSEQQQMLRRAILALPPDQRAVIELRHFQELSYDEMAAALEVSLATVKSRLFRARQQLRQVLEKRL